MAATVSDVLRRFLPEFLRGHRGTLNRAVRRAVWAITRCRTPAMGGHLCGCGACGTREFHYHSCNHRSCPLCGRAATAEWVERELSKRVGAPYFMVNFTLPAELRPLFFTPAARELYQLLFAAASGALSATLADPRWLGAATCGFTAVLHTWTQRLIFHPHIHCIVPGAGLDPAGKLVTVKDPNFLVPQPALRRAFRERFRTGLAALAATHDLPAVDPAVWHKDWGVFLKAFGNGQAAIKYLGAYVCRTAIGDSRILAADDHSVTFRWTDRAKGNALRTETVAGTGFVGRYLLHVLPAGMRAIRYYGFCHPAAKNKREHIAFHTGRPLFVGPFQPPAPKPASAPLSMLRQADERHPPAPAPMAFRPRPAIADLALRMNRHPLTPDRAGLRPHHGHGLQGPRPRAGSSTHLAPQRRPIRLCSTPPGPSHKAPRAPRASCTAPFYTARPIPAGGRQTQAA